MLTKMSDFFKFIIIMAIAKGLVFNDFIKETPSFSGRIGAGSLCSGTEDLEAKNMGL